MQHRDRLINTTALVVRIAALLNRLFLAAVVIGLVLSLAFPTQFISALLQPGPNADVAAMVSGGRLEILIGIAGGTITLWLLAALRQIIASAQAGDPFVAANARHLRTIGWALLGLQLLDIPAALLIRFYPALGSAAPHGTLSIGGWIAVLMVFVLSRIFAAGAVMRDELEGTI
jgi:hypothetical protein